jgi:uncharacterized protein (DUF2141 family)
VAEEWPVFEHCLLSQKAMRHFSYLAVFYLIWIGCANQTSPEGGPKDTQPPKLLSTIPKHNGLNFRGKAVLFEFDEFIKVNSPRDQILIVPNTGKKTAFKVSKNTLSIEPELPWLENTTYSIQLREGVQDVTESNPAQNVYIAFSTGNVIDSLAIEGFITDTFTEKIPEDVTVAIYASDTFDIQKHSPTYFARADKTGKYKIQNLKPGAYRIYAFQDKNKNLKVETKTEKAGYLTTPIILTKDTTKVAIPVCMVDARPLRILNVRKNGTVNLIRFNKFINDYTLSGHTYHHAFGDDQSEIAVFFPEMRPDSTQVRLIARDSVDNRIDTTLWLASRNRTIQETFKLTPELAALTLETNTLEFLATTSKPIARINHDSIYLRADPLTIVLPKAGFALDTLQKKLSFRSALSIPDTLKPDKKWQVVFAPGSLVSAAYDTLKKTTRGLTFMDTESTGILVFDQIITKHKNYLIQVVDSKDRVVRQYKNPTKLTIDYLPAESFKIRAIIDTNDNGKWDAGNIYQNREPEKVIYFKTPEGKYETPVRANWEVGPFRFAF